MSQTAIVTGAASGVGKECTRMLVAKGYRVAAMDLRAEAISAAFADAGNQVVPIAVDIGDIAACQAAVAASIEALEGIDALLHFAAIWVGTPWDKSEPTEWDRIAAVNIKGTFFLTQTVAHHMVARGRGAIVLTTSDSVNVGGVAGGPAYVASKGAVVGLTHSFAKALGPKGVRVNCVAPGLVKTDFARALWEDEDRLKKRCATTPLRRIGEPDEIAGAVAYLASDASTFMTGQTIVVDGGVTTAAV